MSKEAGAGGRFDIFLDSGTNFKFQLSLSLYHFFLISQYSSVPIKREALINRRSEKFPKFIKRGSQDKRGGGWNLRNDFE